MRPKSWNSSQNKEQLCKQSTHSFRPSQQKPIEFHQCSRWLNISRKLQILRISTIFAFHQPKIPVVYTQIKLLAPLLLCLTLRVAAGLKFDHDVNEVRLQLIGAGIEQIPVAGPYLGKIYFMMIQSDEQQEKLMKAIRQEMGEMRVDIELTKVKADMLKFAKETNQTASVLDDLEKHPDSASMKASAISHFGQARGACNTLEAEFEHMTEARKHLMLYMGPSAVMCMAANRDYIRAVSKVFDKNAAETRKASLLCEAMKDYNKWIELGSKAHDEWVEWRDAGLEFNLETIFYDGMKVHAYAKDHIDKSNGKDGVFERVVDMSFADFGEMYKEVAGKVFEWGMAARKIHNEEYNVMSETNLKKFLTEFGEPDMSACTRKKRFAPHSSRH